MEKEKLEKDRLQIDNIDQQILKLLQARFKYSKDIGQSKTKLGMKVADIDRENEIHTNLLKQSQELNLDFEFIKKIWEIIFDKSQEIQNKIYDK